MMTTAAQIAAIQKAFSDMCRRAGDSEVKFATLAGAEVERTAKTLMRDTQTNPDVTYSGGHHPSVPGDAPAVDTGTLRRSITHEVGEEDGTAYSLVGSTILNPPYGAYLEYGTSKMKPRPWLSQALIKCQSFMAELWKSLCKETTDA